MKPPVYLETSELLGAPYLRLYIYGASICDLSANSPVVEAVRNVPEGLYPRVTYEQTSPYLNHARHYVLVENIRLAILTSHNHKQLTAYEMADYQNQYEKFVYDDQFVHLTMSDGRRKLRV